ncbi:MAG TPA: hypothetical protein VIV11_07535 [Kofleriaceae bacterium]
MKNLPSWAFGVLSVLGVVLIGSMALTWIDFGGLFSVRGYRLALDQNPWLLLVPIAGLVLTLAASTRSPHARLAAIFAGIAVAGYVLFGLARSIIHSGVDTWLMLGGAALMLAGAKDRAMVRALGGAAVLAGFFAPWADFSMFFTLRKVYDGELTFNVLWLVPIGGVLGLLSAGNAAQGRKLALAGGAMVYGAFLLVIGVSAWLIFGLGAWLALAASSAALVIGVLARSPAPVVAPVPAAKQ